MSTIKQLLLILSIVALGALFGASLYQSLIEGPNFGANVPDSLEHFHVFMGDNNPGNFFRVVAPAAQILVFVSLLSSTGLARETGVGGCWPLSFLLSAATS